MIKSDIPYINYMLDIIKDIENSVKNISKNKKNLNELPYKGRGIN